MKPPLAGRSAEHGMSVLEALIVTAIAAVLMALLLPLLPQSVRRDGDGARAAISLQGELRGERVFRTVLRSLVQSPGAEPGQVELLAGNAHGLRALAAGEIASGCLDAGAEGESLLVIEPAGDGGRLVCRGPGGMVELLRWSEGAGAFAYSGDGVRWHADWPPQRRREPQQESASVLVRFAVRTGGGEALAWTERAGWTEPVALAQAQAATDAP